MRVILNQGLGDFIALGGALVHLSRQYPALEVNHQPHYARTLGQIFKGHNITFVPPDPWNKRPDGEYVSIQPHAPFGNGTDHYTHIYRDMLGLDYSARWTLCPIKDNRFRTEQQLSIPPQPYAFIHDDVARRFVIMNSYISSGLYIVHPVTPMFESILAYCDWIENAAEVHVMDSSFFHLTEQLDPKGKLFYHRYVRPYTPVWQDYATRHEWMVIS